MTAIGRQSPMGGELFVALSAEHQEAAGVAAGDDVDVAFDLDSQPREVTVPTNVAAVIGENDAARSTFDQLSWTHRKEWVRWIEEAKQEKTRRARIEKAVASLHQGHRTR